MCKKIITLALLSVLTFGASQAAMATASHDTKRGSIEELIERNRWADAKLLLLKYRSELDTAKDLYELEWVDYNLVCCQVELGSSESEQLMLGFMERYPSSQQANRMRFMLGCLYCDDGDFSSAEQLFNKVDYEALNSREKERYSIRMGYITFVKNDYEGALAHFNRIPLKSEYYEHASYYISYIKYQAGKYSDAKSGFEKLRNSDSYCQLIPFYLLQIEYREQNYDYVISQGERLIPTAVSNVRNDLIRIIAESYFVKENYEQAFKYINNYPVSLYGRQENYIKGYSLCRLARYQDAIEPLRNVCGATDALTQNASYHLADCYLHVGDKASAAAAFSMASTEGFDDNITEKALLNYGRLMFELGGGRFNESLNVLKRYLDSYPDSPHCEEVQKLLAAAYYNSKDYRSAYNAIQDIPRRGKELEVACQKSAVFLALDAVARGSYDEATALLKEAEEIGLNPKYKALAIFWQAEVAMLSGDYARAKLLYEDYSRMLSRKQDNYYMAKYGIGYVCFMTGDMENAPTYFTEFTENYPEKDKYLYDSYNRLGDIRFSKREFDGARKSYTAALASTSDERNYARYQLARIDGVQSKYEDKIEKLKSIVEDATGDYVDDAWYELGCTYITLEQYDDGIKALVDFVSVDTTSPFYIKALSDIGLAYYNLNNRQEARTYYEKVVEFDPQSSAALEAMRNIREIYVSEGDIDGYFKYAERSGVQSDMTIAARDSLSFAAARSAYFDANMPKAISALRSYLDNFDAGYNRSEALYYLSDCYIREGNKEKALVSMEELVKHGKSQYSERVLTTMAPMCVEFEYYDKAADAYRRLYDVAHDNAKRVAAVNGYVDSSLKYAEGDAILALADDIETIELASEAVRRKVLIAKGRVLHSRGEAAAYDVFRYLAEDCATVEGVEAYYYLVEEQYLAGNSEVAEQMVYDLGECASMYWQAKCFIILGDIMRDSGNTFQARATYQSIADGYYDANDGIVDEAKSRINEL